MATKTRSFALFASDCGELEQACFVEEFASRSAAQESAEDRAQNENDDFCGQTFFIVELLGKGTPNSLTWED